MYTENFAEGFAPLAAFGAAAATTEQNSGWVSMSKYHRLVILLYAFTTGTSIDLDVEIATDDAAAGLFTLKSITQLVGADDDALVVIDIRADELGKPSGASSENYGWVNVEITPSAAANFTCLVFGADPRYAPIDQTLWAEAVS